MNNMVFSFKSTGVKQVLGRLHVCGCQMCCSAAWQYPNGVIWTIFSRFSFASSAAQAALGVILLFNWHLGPGSLLLADAVIYGGSSVSSGVAGGWATRAATKGTSFNIEKLLDSKTGPFQVRNWLRSIEISHLSPRRSRKGSIEVPCMVQNLRDRSNPCLKQVLRGFGVQNTNIIRKKHKNI